MTDTTNLFHVIDYADKVVIYSGTHEECVMVQDTQYAGLSVIHDSDLKKYGTEVFTEVYVLPPDNTRLTWVLCVKTPITYNEWEYPSATNAVIAGISWLEKRGYQIGIIDIPVKPKK